MKRYRLFLTTSYFMIASAAAVVSKVNAVNVDPEYYINNIGFCVPGPSSFCIKGPDNCLKIINPTEGLKQMYDARIDGECDEGLYEIDY